MLDAVRARVRLRSVRGVIDSALAELPAEYEELHPARDIHRRAPRTAAGDPEDRFRNLRDMVAPAAFRLTLRRGRIAGANPVILTADRRVFLQSAFDREQLMLNAAMDERLPLARMHTGEAMALVGPWHTSHYHWMVDHLPRVALLPLEDRPDLPVIVPSDLSDIQLESLEAVGLGTDRLIPYHHPHVQVDSLIWPSLPGRTGHTPEWAANWLRDRLSPATAPGKRRIYVSRGDAVQRRVVNEDTVATALQVEGFEVAEPGRLSLREQFTLFAEASVIVGAHGAGLVNMLVARDAAVIEAFDPRYVNGCFYSLADALGHDYWYLVAQQAEGDRIRIDTDELRRTIDLATAVHG